MTEALAQALCDRLTAALPFLPTEVGGRAVGLARLYTKPIPNGDATVTGKFPVPVTYTASECEQNERYLMPDLGTPAILFFQDNGSQPVATAQFQPSQGVRTASLNLLLWVNNPLLTRPVEEVELLAAISQALRPNVPQVLGPLSDVFLSYQVLPSETSLYGRYSFADVTPLLLPPRRVVGLAITARFRVNLNCLPATLPGVREGGVLCG